MVDIEEVEKRKQISLPSVVPVKLLAEELNVPVVEIIKKLMISGVMASINESIDFDTASIIADEFETDVLEKKEVESESVAVDDKIYKKKSRPPVVTIMGHVDHGKTKLLDAIRNTNVIETESGGITQHIGAYQTQIESKEGNKKIKRVITFLDTPGHEAFSAMRAHGANITDIVILVVAADEGVKPQTVEAISHARAAKVPIIVAINKIDKPEADIDKIKRELSEYMLIPEQWGGKTAMVPISAKAGTNIEQLLETVLLTADLEDLQASPEAPAKGMVIESKVQAGKGPVATIVMQDGTLKPSDFIICGSDFAKVRFIEDWRGNRVKEALPSDPILVAGFKKAPKVGSILQQVKSEKDGKAIVDKIERQESVKTIAKGIGLGEISQEAKEGKLKELNIILRCDVKGSIEAIKSSFDEISTDDIKLNFVSDAVGPVNDSDINLAISNKAVILAYRVPVPPQVLKMAESNKIKISKYDVIYQLIDDVTAALEGMLEPEIIETKIGKMEVIKIFHLEKGRGVVGGKVLSGKVTPGTKITVLREDEVIGELKTEAVQIGAEKVDQVLENHECGISYTGDVKLKVKDRLEFILVEEHLRTLKKPHSS